MNGYKLSFKLEEYSQKRNIIIPSASSINGRNRCVFGYRCMWNVDLNIKQFYCLRKMCW